MGGGWPRLGQAQVAGCKGGLGDNKGWVELNSPIVISDILPTTLPAQTTGHPTSPSLVNRYAVDIMSDVWVPPELVMGIEVVTMISLFYIRSGGMKQFEFGIQSYCPAT